MLDERSQVRAIRPVRPAVVLNLVHPSSVQEAIAQIVERLLGHSDFERLDRHASRLARDVAAADDVM